MSGIGITCPSCGCGATEVLDTRAVAGENMIRRRRHCTGCGARFKTLEGVAAECTAIDIPGGNVTFDLGKIDLRTRGPRRQLADSAAEIAEALPLLTPEDMSVLAHIAGRMADAALADGDSVSAAA